MHVCDSDESESKVAITDEDLLQVYYTDKSESESAHRSINTNKGKYEIDETEDEEPLVTDNLVINELIYFND